MSPTRSSCCPRSRNGERKSSVRILSYGAAGKSAGFWVRQAAAFLAGVAVFVAGARGTLSHRRVYSLLDIWPRAKTMAELSTRYEADAPSIAREQAEDADETPHHLSTREKLIGLTLASLSMLLVIGALVMKTITG